MASPSSLLVLLSCLCLLLEPTQGQRRGSRRGGRPQVRRGGRQEAGGDYSAPGDGYSAGDVPVYGAASDAVPVYNTASDDDALAALGGSIPGVPGEDYPIYSEVPETGFSCEGQVDGGYYADPQAECQAFHICTADGAGGLAKYSFLCPNGTLFNQNYFICDWWFNFDCSTAESLYSLNDEIAAEREALASDAGLSGYGAPAGYDAGFAAAAPVDYDYSAAPEDYSAAAPAEEYAAGADEAPVYGGGVSRRGRRLGNRRNNRRKSGGGRRGSRRG